MLVSGFLRPKRTLGLSQARVFAAAAVAQRRRRVRSQFSAGAMQLLWQQREAGGVDELRALPEAAKGGQGLVCQGPAVLEIRTQLPDLHLQGTRTRWEINLPQIQSL